MAETVSIDHVGHRGDGIALAPDGRRFVPFALPGEVVEIETTGERSRLLSIVSNSPARVEPFCPHFGRCGGCAVQHWAHDEYLTWKRGLVVSALEQARIDADVKPIIDAHGAGRRRITLHARRNSANEMIVGFAAAQSYAVVPIDRCPILDPKLAGALEAARAIAKVLAVANKPLDIQVTGADEGLDIDVRGSGPLRSPLIAPLSALAEHHRLARLTRHGELVLQRVPPTVTMGRARVALPAGSFLQATAAGEDALACEAIAHARKATSIADLFCGVGPFALRLAESAKVSAFDAEGGAIDALHKAAANTSRLRQVKAASRDLFRRPLSGSELREFDAVIFDPPRQGAEAQATQLALSRVPVVVAVSCNVSTFVRDAAILTKGGYRIGAVTPIDQFRHTPHVELVAAFER